MWEALAERAELKIRLLQPDETLLAEARRSAEWTAVRARSSGLDIGHLRTCSVGRGERQYYALRESARDLVASTDAVLLGAWESPACWQVSLAAKRNGVRRVGFYESTRMSQHHQSGAIARARSRFFRSMDAVVVPGVAAADALRTLGVRPDRIIEGFNAVDVDRFAAVARRAPLGSGHRFIYIGQLITRKNVDGLIRAFARCAAPGDSLTVVGAGDRRADLESLARKEDQTGSIRFTGNVAYQDLPSLLAAHHTLVLPSHEEVWGLVINEALAAGRHVVVSDRAGVALSVRDMPGVFVAKTDAPSLATSLALAKEAWRGPISSPQILKHTPAKFAGTFLVALQANPQ
ncbi:glycosyltransferase [Microbacterium trichothecenolyticum]|uniref:glycosyltransferase n=1 Tax=Microbacterium trichothecenolyticum TaxID=69370 RepID=UPI0027D92E33|nr:glycosyltransferase [Microbacterium trichothecenolyticum]